MNSSRLIVFVAALSVAVPLVALNNADLIKMKQAGLTDETILLSIDKEPANYDTGATGIIDLKNAGLSEAVIQRILLPKEPAVAVSKFAHIPLPSIAPPEVVPTKGVQYFLRSTLHEEDGEYVTTNYARGNVVPINTPVLLQQITAKNLVLKRTDTNEKITIKNIEKYSRQPIEVIARRLLATEQTPLEKLPPELATSIKAGEMRLGMTKELTLMARGYPPGHETPAIEGDRWVFWSSRFIKQTVVFADGRLVEGRGLN